VALDLPDGPRRALAQWRDRAIAGHDDLRPVAAMSLHVTLCFLGWRWEREIERVAELTSAACQALPGVTLTPAGLVAVPPRRTRLFALDLEDDGERAATLQAAVAGRLSQAGLYEPERRPFWPHLTLARVKRGKEAAPLDAAPPPSDAFEASDVTLYRSTLRPQGALYEPLVRVTLGS
jgi:RNA 2',3'-cyclic 3'-phosphodiesterase